MNRIHFTGGLFLIVFYLLNIGNVLAVVGARDMNNIAMIPYAENMFLFYRCGDDLYFNHEIKKLRQENGGSVTFNWYNNQTLIGLMYCDGFGFPMLKEKMAAQDISVTILPNQMEVFYSPLSNRELVKKTSYKKIPGDLPQGKDWISSGNLKKTDGSDVLADSYQAFEFNGKSYLLSSYRGKLSLYTPEKKSLSFDLPVNIDRNKPVRASMSLGKGTATLYAMLPTGDHFTWLKLDLMRLLKGQFQYSNEAMKFFYAPGELTSYELKTPLNGKVTVYYVRQGEQQKSELNVESATPKTFGNHSGFTRAFNFNREDKRFDLFQMPLACRPDRDCMLVNFTYPKAADFFGNATSLLHATYGGKVIAVALNTLPTKQEKMELIGIIEGPPPVPLDNVLSSLKETSPTMLLDAAKDLSRWIFTEVDQSITFTSSKSRAESKNTTHMVQLGGNIPTAVPIILTAMGEFSSKLMREDFFQTTGTLKKSFINEVQHIKDTKGKLQARPIGKLIFLKYDLKAYRYVFKDEHDKVNEDGPQLFSIAKTNYRPIVRPYEIIAKRVNPGKYRSHIVVGDITSYSSIQRRRTLLDKASVLSPGHNYLAYTYNNMLDLSTQFDMTTTNRITTENTETVTAELGGGLGTDETPISLNFSVKSQEERVYTLVNERSTGMAISAAIGMPLLPQDPRVKSYDFEMYYLAPEHSIATDMIEELNDTQSKSFMNKKLAEMILPNSRPWKVTYTVSEIRNAVADDNPPAPRSNKYLDVLPGEVSDDSGEKDPVIRWTF